MEKKNKTPYDTQGYKHNCVNYNPCPLCYGCRNYDASYAKCVNLCGSKNKKFNVCDRYKHRDDLLARMIKREVIDLDKKG